MFFDNFRIFNNIDLNALIRDKHEDEEVEHEIEHEEVHETEKHEDEEVHETEKHEDEEHRVEETEKHEDEEHRVEETEEQKTEKDGCTDLHICDKLDMFRADKKVAMKLFDLNKETENILQPLDHMTLASMINNDDCENVNLKNYKFTDNSEEHIYLSLKRMLIKNPDLVKYVNNNVFYSKYFVRDCLEWEYWNFHVHSKVLCNLYEKFPGIYNTYTFTSDVSPIC